MNEEKEKKAIARMEILAKYSVFFAFSKPMQEDIQKKVAMFSEPLAEVPADILEKAMVKIAEKETFFPTYSKIYQTCQMVCLRMLGLEIPNKYDAWNEAKMWMFRGTKYSPNAIVEIVLRKMGKTRLRNESEKSMPAMRQEFLSLFDDVVEKCLEYAFPLYTHDWDEVPPRYNFVRVQQEIDTEWGRSADDKNVVYLPALKKKEEQKPKKTKRAKKRRLVDPDKMQKDIDRIFANNPHYQQIKATKELESEKKEEPSEKEN